MLLPYGSCPSLYQYCRPSSSKTHSPSPRPSTPPSPTHQSIPNSPTPSATNSNHISVTEEEAEELGIFPPRWNGKATFTVLTPFEEMLLTTMRHTREEESQEQEYTFKLRMLMSHDDDDDDELNPDHGFNAVANWTMEQESAPAACDDDDIPWAERGEDIPDAEEEMKPSSRLALLEDMFASKRRRIKPALGLMRPRFALVDVETIRESEAMVSRGWSHIFGSTNPKVQSVTVLPPESLDSPIDEEATAVASSDIACGEEESALPSSTLAQLTNTYETNFTNTNSIFPSSVLSTMAGTFSEPFADLPYSPPQATSAINTQPESVSGGSSRHPLDAPSLSEQLESVTSENLRLIGPTMVPPQEQELQVPGGEEVVFVVGEGDGADNKEEEVKEEEIKEEEIKEEEIKENGIKEVEINDEEIKEEKSAEAKREEEEIKEGEIKDKKIEDKEIQDEETKKEETKEEQIKTEEIKEGEIKDEEIKQEETKEEEIPSEAPAPPETERETALRLHRAHIAEIKIINQEKIKQILETASQMPPRPITWTIGGRTKEQWAAAKQFRARQAAEKEARKAEEKRKLNETVERLLELYPYDPLRPVTRRRGGR